ncbi:hypothetical protein OG194_35570 [Streptomyces sp. NBC_01288]|uniref:hypothetical protein n=1 Tax=Streptomyces sp. NBC_01288 TaxID=2903814 RepID=UPI002E0D58F5|nr:hypothetical protein OG194_35570 [Streptomyces sp. NBC_01288]
MTTLDERRGEDAREAAGAYRPDAAVSLGQLTAIQTLFAGSKAANLARAARAGWSNRRCRWSPSAGWWTRRDACCRGSETAHQGPQGLRPTAP